MEAVKTLLTAEDLWRMPGDSHRYELVKGDLVEMTPPGGQHGDIATTLAFQLRSHVLSAQLGKVLVESGFCLECRPDTVRGPDVAFLASAHIPAGGLPKGFIPGAPDLAAEVVSPGDTVSEIQAKVQDYLSHGCRLVWVVEPDTRTVTIYRPDGSARLLRAEETLDGEDVIPGFNCPVADIFPS